MGDGFMVEMTRSELRADIEQATAQAAAKAKAPPLTADEQACLLDVFASPAAFTAVDIGDQVVLRCDGSQVGSGDSKGMDDTHALAAGMGGIRTAGDLVAWRQMSRGMRLKEAKEYVARKLCCTVRDLSDSYAVEQIRGEKGLVRILDHSNLHPREPNAMMAKFRIAELLGIRINSVERFRDLTGL